MRIIKPLSDNTAYTAHSVRRNFVYAGNVIRNNRGRAFDGSKKESISFQRKHALGA